MSRNFKSRSKLKGLELQCLKMKERTSVGLQRNIIAKTKQIKLKLQTTTFIPKNMEMWQ